MFNSNRLSIDGAALDTDKQKQKQRQKVLVSGLGELRLSSTQGKLWSPISTIENSELSVVLGYTNKLLSDAALKPQGLASSKVR